MTSEHAMAQRLGDLLGDVVQPWRDIPHQPLFASVADATHYALERRDGLLKRALELSRRDK